MSLRALARVAGDPIPPERNTSLWSAGSRSSNLGPRTSAGWRIATAFAVTALTLSSACQTQKSLYVWGYYPESVFEVCRGAGTLDLTKDVQKLSQEVDRANAEGRRVAPGVHAHLGYLYYMAGNSGAAVAQFNAEKETYPESAKFIDGMLARMKSSPAGTEKPSEVKS